VDIPEIVQMLRDGDPSASALLVAVLGPQLYSYAAALAPDLPQVDRELAVESAVTTLATRIDNYDESQASLATWARGFVRFALLRARRTRGPGQVELSDNVAFATGLTGEGNERDIRLSELLMSGLTDAEYLLLTLRIVEQLSHVHIASQLNVTEDAVKKRYQRLLEKIRSMTAGDPLLDPTSSLDDRN
jgi:RNA polymerase sigma factor (sigma-70 family)